MQVGGDGHSDEGNEHPAAKPKKRQVYNACLLLAPSGQLSLTYLTLRVAILPHRTSCLFRYLLCTSAQCTQE